MTESKPNIVLVTMDSLRADHCSFNGYARETTPTLDEMAAEGVTFENAIASGVPTIASMTSVMTGQISLASPEIGFNEEQREQMTSRRTVAEALSEAGYTTGALSPNPPASSYFGFDEGFDWFEDFLHEDRGVFERAWNRIHQRSIEGGGLATYLRLFRNVVQREEVLRPWDDYYDLIREFCETAEEPYFLWVLLLEPHHPWLPPKEEQRWSSRSDVYRSFQYYWRMLNEDWKPDFSPAERQRLLDLYDDSIRHGDRFLARLRRDLRGDDPVFVVHADHGEEFGEHGRYGHQPYLYENLVDVPLVIANAGERADVTHPVELRSLAPTIADLGGIPSAFPGRSLLADTRAGRDGDESDVDVDDASARAERPWVFSKVFAEGDRRLAVRTEDLKYISDADGRELYDLRLDPDEQVDLIGDRSEVAASLEALSDRHVAGERETRLISGGVADLSAGGADL